jgi:hypothetical protein
MTTASEALAIARQTNPFAINVYDGGAKPLICYAGTVAERLRAVPTFTAAQCQIALCMTGLQKAVRTAIERRLEQLEGS